MPDSVLRSEAVTVSVFWSKRVSDLGFARKAGSIPTPNYYIFEPLKHPFERLTTAKPAWDPGAQSSLVGQTLPHPPANPKPCVDGTKKQKPLSMSIDGLPPAVSRCHQTLQTLSACRSKDPGTYIRNPHTPAAQGAT